VEWFVTAAREESCGGRTYRAKRSLPSSKKTSNQARCDAVVVDVARCCGCRMSMISVGASERQSANFALENKVQREDEKYRARK
jgi:hypothetical protein